MRDVRAENHLLWRLLARHLEEGRADDAAVVSGERSLSYGRLARVVERGAREIDERLAAGSRILVAVRDQLHAGVALCAALHSRAIPLLADPTSPARLARLAREWGAAGAILEQPMDRGGIATIESGAVEGWLEAGSASSFAPKAVAPDEPAFWTFTSGTTGEPRAVVHAHRGPAAAYQAFARGVLDLGPEDVTIATAGLPFVYALGNAFFFPLLAGGTAILPADLLLPTVLGELGRHGATILVAGPWSLSGIVRLAPRPRWVEPIRRLRCVLSAGEPLPPRVFHEWRERFGKEVLDNLGCSEMFNSFVSHRRGRARAGSVGYAVPGFDLRVGGKAAAAGARGALAVRGESRAVATGRGGGISAPHDEWCETGDDVEVGPDGALVFLGRRDDRFKVKGRFLYPLEVEQALGEVAEVAQCLVVPDTNAEGITIAVANVVLAAGAVHEGLVGRLLRHARERLEPFAVPHRIDVVDALPRNERGKLERRGRKGP